MAESDFNNAENNEQSFEGSGDFNDSSRDEAQASGGDGAGDEKSAATESSKIEQLNPQSKDKEIEEWKNKVVYLSAEIDNMRKRFAREKAEVIKHGNEDLIQRLLPVVDNLELAVKSLKNADVKDNPVVANLAKGVEMTLKHFEQTLEQVGAQPLVAKGKAFDPTQHEAVGQAQSTEVENEHVANEVQRGWTLNGRVVRPARVLVNKLANS